jgi:hypothetical protein
MKYLGMPVSSMKISKAQLSYVSDKTEKRLGTWQCEYLSSGGKSILIDSCLSSIPMYTMGVYQLYEGNFQRLDSIRARFYWQGTSKKRKYHMIKWEALSRPKEFGGLGFLDVRAMNVCLLAKWIDKLERGDDSLCCSLLKKYLGEKSIFQIKNRRGSQFWRSLLDVRDWYQRGRGVSIKSGMQTRFWHDCWVGGCPLKIKFPNLFKITLDPDLEVSKACVDGEWSIQFRRQFNECLADDWNNLLEVLSDVALSTGRDQVFWLLDRSKKYSARSLYRIMTSGGVIDRQMMQIWKCNVPLKVKIFMWMTAHDRIQCAVQLKKKKWSREEECFVCGKLETSDHIIFQCPIAVFLWSFLRDSLGWEISPICCDSFFRDIIERCRGKRREVTLFICAGAMWTIWKARNDVVFNKKTLSSPIVLVYRVISLVKTWTPLLKSKLKPLAEEMLQRVSANATSL